MSRLCLDCGHGGAQPGASFRNIIEKNVTLPIALQAGKMILDTNLHEVIFTRTEDVTVSLFDRVRICNESNCEVFISVHVNAAPDHGDEGTEAEGEEIWFYRGGQKSRALAEIMSKWVNQIFPDEPFRGIKETETFYVLKYTNCPAILIEIGFIDKISTNDSLSNPVTITRATGLIANGFNEYSKIISGGS